jgi:hypothetical protein
MTKGQTLAKGRTLATASDMPVGDNQDTITAAPRGRRAGRTRLCAALLCDRRQLESRRQQLPKTS